MMFPRIENYNFHIPLRGLYEFLDNSIKTSRNHYAKYEKANYRNKLPNIFIKNFGAINQNMNNETDEIEDQIEDEEKEKEVEEEKIQKDNVSQIYINNIFDKKLYLLTFNPINVRLQAVYLKDRTFEENDNDKCIQSRSKAYYTNKFYHKNTKLNLMKKVFAIDKKNSRLSIMDNKKPFMKARERGPNPVSRKQPISRPETNIGTSVIYIKYQDVDFDLYPGVINLKLSRRLDQTEDQKQLLEELQMEATDKMKNKARFIVRHKDDILLFNFDIENLSFSRIKEMISRGIQVEDRNYYVNTISPVTDKITYFAIPETTYDYVDQTQKLALKNYHLKINKLEPWWVQETRVQRIQDYKRCRVEDPYKDIWEIKLGSNFCYEDNGSLYKAKTGLIKCDVEDQAYENWVADLLRVSNKKPPSKHSSSSQVAVNKNLYSYTSDGIPDWDLVVNSL